MAVEIPVIIDIDKAFTDAAARVSQAIRPLQSAIDGQGLHTQITIGNLENSNKELSELNKYYRELENADWSRVGSKLDLSPYINQALMQLQGLEKKLAEIQELRKLEGGRGDFSFAEEYKQINQEITNVASSINAMQVAQTQLNSTLSGNGVFQNHLRSLTETNTELVKMREYYRALERESSQMSDSINAIKGRISELNAEWNQMTKAERQSDRGDKVYQQYREEVKALREEALALSQVYQKELDRDRLRKQGAQKLRYENAILNATKVSMKVLQEQERILSDRLNRMNIQNSGYAKLKADLDAVRLKMQQLQGTTTGVTNAMASQSTVLRQLTSYASMYISVFGAMRFLKQIKDVTAELEYQRVALGHLLQDEEYGAQLFERIKQAALESPFRITQLVTYTKQLAAYRIEQENLFDVTKRLADVSAGLGVDMNRLILAYGQVRAASVLRGQELRQFTEAGIPLVELLAKKFTELRGYMVSTADVFKLISERAVPFSMIAEIFEDLTDKGGMFYEMQKIQADTLKGKWEKLKDAFDIGLQSIGESKGLLNFRNELNLLLKALNFLSRNLRLVPKLLEGGTAAWVIYKLAMLATGNATKKVVTSQVRLAAMQRASATGAKVGSLAHRRLTAAYLAQDAAANKLTLTLARLRVALWTNPWIAAAAAVAGLAVSFLSFRKNADDAVSSAQDMETAIEGMNKANSRAVKEKKLIESYEKLSKNTNRTAEENTRLADTIFKLKEAYPELIEQIGNENVALKDQVKALDDARKAKLDATREEAEQLLAIEESKNVDLRKKQEEAREEYLTAFSKFVNDAKNVAADTAEGEELTKQLLGEDYADLISSDRLEKFETKSREAAEEAWGKLDEVNQELEKSDRLISRLKAQLNPEEANKDLEEWQNQILKIQAAKIAQGEVPLFTEDDVKGFSSVYDMSQKLEKKMKDLTVSIAGMKAMLASLPEGSPAWLSTDSDIKREEKQLEVGQDIKDLFHLIFKSSSGKKGSGTDPFITLMQNRIKFMQDFKKGYDDLSKYMSSAQAEIEESTIMLGRGQSLGLSADQQLRAANGLSKWYEDMIEDVKKKLREKGVSGVSATDFLSVDTTKKSKAVQDLQKLLQQLWDAKTDYDTSERKKQIEDALKKLSEEIKRSETAKNFFENVLGLTGDKELAGNLAVSVYGDPGEEIGTRIKDSIEGALDGMKLDKTSGIGKTLLDAAGNMDFREVMKNIDQVPQDLRETVKNAAAVVEKYNTDTANSYVKLLMQFDEIGQKRRTIEDKADKDIATLREGLALELKAINEKMEGAEKEAAEKAAKAREEAAEEGVNRQRELDLLRTSRDYRLFFETIGTISLASARKIAKAERDIVSAQFEAHEINLNQYLRALNRIDEQLKKYEDERNPIVTYLTKGLDGLFEKLKQTDIHLRAFAGNLKDDEGNFSLPEGLKEAVNTIGKIFGGSIFGENIKGRKNVFDQLKEELKENADAWEETLDRVAEKLGEMGSDMSRGFGWAGFWVSFAGGAVKSFDQIAQKSKNTEGEVKEGWNAVGKFIMTSAAGMLVGNPLGAGVLGQLWDVDDAWERFTSLNEKAMSGFEKFKSGDIIGAIADNIEGWSEVFGKNTKAIDRQIKEQSDNIEELKYQYDRLGVAIEDAFGSDYIYNFQKQVEVLQAQAEAYRKQAELEQQKGDKKRDDEKIKGYKNSAREIEDQIKDMQGQLAEFFTGTDLTSAARDFAQAWIEAYKEFGSTTDAMKEKFDDMIENMVVNSLAARLIQGVLDPLFKQIDAAAQGGDLTAQEMGAIATQVPGLMDQINNSMGTLMGQLTTAGINLRQQAGQFTGISRDIAGASEESILGLAAGVNTANFYMSHLPAIAENVAALRAYIVGDAAATVRTTASEGPTYEDQMLGYAANLPMMRDDMYAIRSLLEKVIKPVGSAYYVSVR